MSGLGRLKNVPRFDLYAPPRKLRILANISRNPAKNPLSLSLPLPSPPVVDHPRHRRFMGEFHSSSVIHESRCASSPTILLHFAIVFVGNDDRTARFLRPPPRDINYRKGGGDERRENQGVNGRDTWRGNDRFVAMTQRLPRGGRGGGNSISMGARKMSLCYFTKETRCQETIILGQFLLHPTRFLSKLDVPMLRVVGEPPPPPPLSCASTYRRFDPLPLPPILLSNFRDGNHDAFPCTRQGK